MIKPPSGYQVIAMGSAVIAVDKKGPGKMMRYNEATDAFEEVWPTSVKSYASFSSGNGGVQTRDFEE